MSAWILSLAPERRPEPMGRAWLALRPAGCLAATMRYSRPAPHRRKGARRPRQAACSFHDAPPVVPPLDAPIASAAASDARSPQPSSMANASRMLGGQFWRQLPVARRRRFAEGMRADRDPACGRAWKGRVGVKARGDLGFPDHCSHLHLRLDIAPDFTA